MRKILKNNPDRRTGGNGDDPFDEDDIGKRFELLKQQMNVQENNDEGFDAKSAEVIGDQGLSDYNSVQDPAGPVSGIPRR